MHPLLSRWDRVELSARADDVLDVYAAAMDTTKAKELLGWRPAFTGLEALRATLDR